MGIRFACHHCKEPMHLKDFLAGKRGKCPACQKSFRIPMHSADYSLPIEDVSDNAVTAPSQVAVATSKATVSNKTTLKSPAESRPAETKQTDAPKHVAKPNRLPQVIESVPNAQWFVRPPSGGQYGPAEGELLVQWCRENRVTADSLIWREGQSQWVTAGQLLPELFSASTDTSSSKSGPPPLPSSMSPELVAEGGKRLGSIDSPEVSASTIALSSRPIQRKVQQNRKQWVIISVLATVCLCLFAGLIVVLLIQK